MHASSLFALLATASVSLLGASASPVAESPALAVSARTTPPKKIIQACTTEDDCKCTSGACDCSGGEVSTCTAPDGSPLASDDEVAGWCTCQAS